MVEIKVDASKIKGEGKEITSKLAAFLKEKSGGDVSIDGGKLLVKSDAIGVDKKYVKVLLNKFLHHSELKKNYRIIASEEDTLKINKRKSVEED